MNLNMKNLFGQANKGFGKLKGFIFGSQSTEESSSATSEESNQKINPTQDQKSETNAKSPAKDDSKNNTIIKSSKGQFDFSEEDDEEDSKPKKNQAESDSKNKNFEYSEPEEDYWRIAHRLYLKNSMVDIEPLPYVPFIKVKKNDNILSLIGFGKKNQIKEIKYFAVFDEHFLYMINMTTKDNNQNNFFKKIGNHYDLTKISNIEIKDDEILEGKKSIKLVFLLDNDGNNFNTIEKELHFEKNDAKKFFEILKFYLKKYDVPLIFQEKGKDKEGNEDDDEDDEEEEEEDDEEENEKKDSEDKKEIKDVKDKKENDKDENSKIEEDKKEKRDVKEEAPVFEEKKENKVEDKSENKEENKDKENANDNNKKEENKEEKKEEEKKDEKENKEEDKKEEIKEEKKEEEKKEEEKKDEKKEEEKKEEAKEEDKKEENAETK